MSDSALLSNKESENEKWTSTRPASSRPLVQHSVRIQVTVVLLFFAFFSLFLFLLEWKLTEDRRKLEFDYKEFYLRPFHYKLDPFSYVELRNGVPITEPEPPNPYFSLSFEELLLNRFVDYLFWTRGPTDEADVTVAQDRLPLTIQAFAGHLRNRIYYRKEHGDLTDLDPLLVNSTEQPNTELEASVESGHPSTEVNKLVWTTIPYCTDPLLEEALHELGNIHGFMFVRGNHKNYRFLDEQDSKTVSTLLSETPMKLAYLYDHNYINFTRFGFKPPVHVSIICEPMERKLRHFYTERHNYRNWAEDFPIATTKWWRQTLEECMNSTDSRECRYQGVQDIKRRSLLDIGRTWLPRRVEWITPQFCDFDRCHELGNADDLAYVKDNVRHDYTVVGTLEQLDSTLQLLEAKVPQFFKGIKQIYNAKVAEAAKHKKEDVIEIPAVSAEVRAEMEKRYAPEIDFYRFISDHLKTQTQQLQS